MRRAAPLRGAWVGRAAVPNRFGTRDRFHGRQFFHGLGCGEWFWGDSNALHLLCTLFLLGLPSACNAGDPGSIPGSGREWLPIPVFLPGEFHGQRSLAGYSPWGHKKLDTTE